MRLFGKIILLLFLAIGIFLVIGLTRTFIISSSENYRETYTGKITRVYDGGMYDLCFKIEGYDKTFYINRGLENGFSVDSMTLQLMGKEVEFIAPKDHRRLLDPKNISKHIFVLKEGDKVFYDELQSSQTNIH